MAKDQKIIQVQDYQKILRVLFLIALVSICFYEISSCYSLTSDQRLFGESADGDWEYVGPGGGGAMFCPTVSPHNPKIALVSCDMTGSFITYNGGQLWRMFNLRGAVSFFVFDPVDSNTIYANSIGLFKSIDKGISWSLVYPSPEEVVGLVSKGDHAQEQIVTKDRTESSVLALAVDPANSEKLFAVITSDGLTALFISNDGGLHWKKERDLEDGIQDVFIKPSSPINDRTIFVTGKNSVFVRKNGIWKRNSGPSGVKYVTNYSAGFNSKEDKFIIYAISGKGYFNATKELLGIFYSEDGGETWENRQEGLLRLNEEGAAAPEWRSISTCRDNPEVVYVSFNNLTIDKQTEGIGVAKSQDYGQTWELSWIDQFSNGKSFPAANFHGGWLNERFGPGWGENPFAIGVAPTNPNIVYTTDFGRTIKTTDGGKNWQQVYSKKLENGGWRSKGLQVTTGYGIVFDPFDQKHVFLLNTDTGLMESFDGGESWESATRNNGIPASWINSTYWLVFDPDIAGRVWAVMSGTHDLPRPKMWRAGGVEKFKGGILFSKNAGRIWTPVSNQLGEAAFTNIVIDEDSDPDQRILYACAFGKGVYKSVDGGQSWQLRNKGIRGNEPLAWRIERRKQDGVLFLIQSRRSEDGSIGNEDDGVLYRSDDNAETWQEVKMPSGVNAPTSLIIDAFDSTHFLLSAWGRKTDGKFSPDQGGGIYLSHDEGKTWSNVLVEDQHIHDLSYDPRNKTYYACGFNGSAYRSVDGGRSWTRIKGYNFKWGKRVEIDPNDPNKIFIITFGGGVWHGPANGIRQTIEDIKTPELAY